MAVSSPRSVPAAKFRYGVLLTGPVNGANTSFTTPEFFRQSPPTASIAVYYNGQRILLDDDFTVQESGGAGTGYDTVNTIFTPKAGDKLWADYVAL
jgi:hypothetical protein